LLKTRVAVFVSGGGTNLQAIIDAQKNGIIKSGEVVRVISNNPNAYAVTRAKTPVYRSALSQKGMRQPGST
jgi:phosphoribosylglycinamide formyltransferase-1